ncbi:hypothetical protein [Coxiella burnetii]|uniref:hypothetical protein n=1 Tax=Coxiella burnetii TaxID=777 RepID=UPI001ED98446|nr:hypothetical protein [Coxiella burnetii]
MGPYSTANKIINAVIKRLGINERCEYITSYGKERYKLKIWYKEEVIDNLAQALPKVINYSLYQNATPEIKLALRNTIADFLIKKCENPDEAVLYLNNFYTDRPLRRSGYDPESSSIQVLYPCTKREHGFLDFHEWPYRSVVFPKILFRNKENMKSSLYKALNHDFKQFLIDPRQTYAQAMRTGSHILFSQNNDVPLLISSFLVNIPNDSNAVSQSTNVPSP